MKASITLGFFSDLTGTDTNYLALVLSHFRLGAGLFFKVSEPKFSEFQFAATNRFARRIDSNHPALVFASTSCTSYLGLASDQLASVFVLNRS